MPSWSWIVISAAAVVAAAALIARFVFTSEARRRRVFPLMRPLYQHVFNPRALRAAAQGDTTWAVMHHVGRRSGVHYDTPIDAQRTADRVLIPLVYGPTADWCR